MCVYGFFKFVVFTLVYPTNPTRYKAQKDHCDAPTYISSYLFANVFFLLSQAPNTSLLCAVSV